MTGFLKTISQRNLIGGGATAVIAGAGKEIGHGHGPLHHFHAWW